MAFRLSSAVFKNNFGAPVSMAGGGAFPRTGAPRWRRPDDPPELCGDRSGRGTVATLAPA
jgi:hypothetical protein